MPLCYNGCAIQANGSHGFFVQAPFYFMAHFSKYLPPGSTVVGAMAYEGANAPAPPGGFWYGVGDEGIKGLGVLGAELRNGTSVLL